MTKEYGGGQCIDVLVNNAGFAFKNAATEPIHVQAKETIAINYFGTKQCCEALFPLLKDGARVVNISSSCGFLGTYTTWGCLCLGGGEGGFKRFAVQIIEMSKTAT